MDKKKSKIGNGKYYDVLGLNRYCTLNEIKKSYRALILIHHPDKNSTESHDKFINIKKAYDVLIDREKRLRYNKKLVHGIDGDLTSSDDDDEAISRKRKSSHSGEAANAMRNADFIRKQFDKIEEDEYSCRPKKTKTAFTECPKNSDYYSQSSKKDKSNFTKEYHSFANLF